MPGRISNALYGPVFARIYDRMSEDSESAGLRDTRRELLARAHGRTLEIGAGTGMNLGLYPESVAELVLTEPDPHMRAQLERKGGTVVDADAQRLPLEDASFDTAVATLALCTVDDHHAALRELMRVLRPGGLLLFVEHVRADDEKLARRQDRFERPWGWFARGCHPNRDTLAAIRAAGFDVTEVRREEIPNAPKLVRPLIVGAAARPLERRPPDSR